jgi:hypothetical protein
MQTSKLTQKDVQEFFNYDEKTGKLFWKSVHSWKNRHIINSRNANKEAGSLSNNGYLIVGLKQKLYKVHRIIWLYVYGYCPENYIDHINRDKTDNRIENLREVSNQCNVRNSKLQRNNKSTIKGISWHKETCKWVVKIRLNGKNYYLGIYKDFYEAACIRLATEQCLDWNS